MNYIQDTAKYIMVLSMGIMLLGCDNQKEQIQEVAFNVDFDIMESAVRDTTLKLGYSLPKGFYEIAINTDSLPLSATNASSLKIDLKRLFKAKSGSMMIALSHLDDDQTDIQAVLSAPDSLLNQNRYFDNFQAAEFRFNNFEKVHQFIQSNGQLVNFRMIFENARSEYVQIDCLSDQSDYLQNIKLFESFFGCLYATK